MLTLQTAPCGPTHTRIPAHAPTRNPAPTAAAVDEPPPTEVGTISESLTVTTPTPPKRGRPRKTEIQRGAFMFMRSWRDALAQLPDQDALAIFRAISDYALDGTLPEFDSGLRKLTWTMLFPTLNFGRKMAKNGKKSAGKRPQMYGNQNAVQFNTKTTQRGKDEIKEETEEINPVDPPSEGHGATATDSGFSPIVEPADSGDFAAWVRHLTDPVAACLEVAGEDAEKRGVYGRLLADCCRGYGKRKGRRLFQDEVIAFHAELESGEEPRNRGAALTARLRNLSAMGGGTAAVPTSPAVQPVAAEVAEVVSSLAAKTGAGAPVNLGAVCVSEFIAQGCPGWSEDRSRRLKAWADEAEGRGRWAVSLAIQQGRI